MELDDAAIIEARREYSKLLKEADARGSAIRECGSDAG